MNGKSLLLSIVAVIVSFVGGFLVANALNRNDLTALRAENDRLKNASTQTASNDSGLSLSDAEVREKIAEADQNPTNFNFQKNLGLALYRYAAMKQDSKLLAEVARLLNRAFENNPKDYDVLVTLGNIYFDIGYYEKNNQQFEKSREFYQKALDQKPSDADVRTDFGLTYFLVDPPDYDRAAAEFQKSLQANPKHEKTLQVLAQTFIKQNKASEAEKFIARLKEVNAKNQYLPELESQISTLKNNS